MGKLSLDLLRAVSYADPDVVDTTRRLQRENAIMRQAIRKSQHYLGRHLEPGNLSATECINGLLKTLDNDEINEVTKIRKIENGHH